MTLKKSTVYSIASAIMAVIPSVWIAVEYGILTFLSIFMLIWANNVSISAQRLMKKRV